MQHRHLEPTTLWSRAAIDSVLERGDLCDWRELFAAAADDPSLAEAIVDVARRHPTSGSALAIHLATRDAATAAGGGVLS